MFVGSNPRVFPFVDVVLTAAHSPGSHSRIHSRLRARPSAERRQRLGWSHRWLLEHYWLPLRLRRLTQNHAMARQYPVQGALHLGKHNPGIYCRRLDHFCPGARSTTRPFTSAGGECVHVFPVPLRKHVSLASADQASLSNTIPRLDRLVSFLVLYYHFHRQYLCRPAPP